MNTTTKTAPSLVMLTLRELQPNPWNRKHFNPDKLQELADSIAAQGIVQPLVVRSNRTKDAGYEIIAGERRWRAAELAKLDTLPCVVRQLDDREARELCAIENLQREDLTAIEEAQGYSDLLKECQCKVEDLEARLGRKRSHIYARLRLLTLPESVKQALGEGKIEASVADLIATIPEAKQREAALKEVTSLAEWDEDLCKQVPMVMSFRRARGVVEEKFRKPLKSAPFDLKQEQLAGVVSCQVCPLRTGNIAGLPHGSAPNVCTAPACYARKVEAHASALLAKHKAAGEAVLEGKDAPKWQYGGLSYNSGYMASEAKKWVKDKHVPVTTLLGKKMPAPAYAVNPEGEVVAVYREKEVQAALVAAGLERPREEAKPESEADIEKQKLDRKVNERVSDRLVTKLIDEVEVCPQSELADVLLFYIEQLNYAAGFNDELIQRRRQWDAGRQAVDAAREMSFRGRLALIVESGLSDQYAETCATEQVAALAKALGVKLDKKAIEKAVRAELVAEAKTAGGKVGGGESEKPKVAVSVGKLAPGVWPKKAAKAKPAKATKPTKPSTKATK